MDYREQEEEKNKRIGLLTALAVQLCLVVIAYLIVAWKAPNPPNEVYGIELGFIESTNASGSSNSEPVETQESTPTEDANTEAIEDETSSQATEPTIEAIEETSAEVSPESIQEAESTPEKPAQELPAEEMNPTQIDEIDPQEEKESEPQTKEEALEEIIEKPTVNKRALMGGTSTQQEEENSNNQSEELDERALLGQNGGKSSGESGSDETSFDLAGWKWDAKPDPKDRTEESGKIVYSIKVDEEGLIIKAIPVSSTVSPELERLYRKAVQGLTFSKINSFSTAARVSEGTITFIIQTK